MSIFNKVKLKKTLQNNVTFTYEQNGVSLNFTLDVNNKQQMQDFKDLLSAGNDDINKYIIEKSKPEEVA